MPEINLIVGREFPTKVIPLIKDAKKTIDIVVFEWRWYPDQIGSTIQKFNNEIIKASRKNCRVRVLVQSRKVLGPLQNCDIDARKLTSKRLLHTKLMIIDNEIVVIGSHNYTMNAFTINHEVSAILQDEKVVKRLREYFQNLWV